MYVINSVVTYSGYLYSKLLLKSDIYSIFVTTCYM